MKIENLEKYDREEIENKMKQLRELALKNRPVIYEGYDMSKDTSIDKLYDAEVYLYREPGMRSSIQVVTSHLENEDYITTSVLTLTASYLETLLSKNIITPTLLEDLVDQVLNNCRKNS